MKLPRTLRGLFARVPVIAGDLLLSYLDAEDRRDGWGLGGNVEDVGLFPGAHKTLVDQRWPADVIASAEATVRAANEPRR